RMFQQVWNVVPASEEDDPFVDTKLPRKHFKLVAFFSLPRDDYLEIQPGSASAHGRRRSDQPVPSLLRQEVSHAEDPDTRGAHVPIIRVEGQVDTVRNK